MPQTMRNLSMISPLNWSLEGFYELMLRGGDYTTVLLNALKLIVFFFVTMTVASVVNRIKKEV
jgi:ABC-2 type transport system permease protein